MATPEEIRKQNLEESNEALAKSLDLTAQLSDQMTFLYKTAKDKYTQDKLAVDLTKAAVSLTKNLSSEYNSLKDVEKDIAKNKKLQNEISRTQINLEKQIGAAGIANLKQIKDEKKLLESKTKELEKAREQQEAGVKGSKKIADSLAQEIIKLRQSNASRIENLSSEERQYQLLEQTGEALEKNNAYLLEQQRRQENLNKSSSLFTSALTGANKALGKLGFGNLASKLGLEAATKKAQEMTYTLTEGGKKSLGMFGKLRVGVATFGAALKTALGPMALIGIAVSLFNKFKEIGKEAAEAMRAVDQSTKDLGRDLGVSNKVASQVAGSAMSIGSAMGVTTDIAINSAKSIYSSLDGAEQVSQKTLSTFIKLNIFAGMSADSLAGVYKFAKLSGEEAATVAENIATTAQESIKTQKVNVSMKQVMDGVSKTSNIMKLNFGGSAKGLTEAFIASKKLGLELGKVEDIANSLLNIEDSIAAEMEAELLTGKDLNLEKAREAALNNDTKGLMTEIANQFGSIEDFQKMNRIQQEAFAKSIGMSREGLADMLVASKENQATNTKNVDTQQKSLNAMMSMASASERLAAAEEAKNLAASNTAAQYTKFEELMLKIQTVGRKLMDGVFGPIGESASGILESVSNWLDKTKNIERISNFIKGAVDGIKYAFGEVWAIVSPIAETLGRLALNLLPVIQAIWEKIKPVVMNIKDFIVEVVSSLGSLIEKLTTGNGEFTTMEKVVGSIAGILLGIKATMIAINTYKFLANKYDQISETFAKGKLVLQKAINSELVKEGIQMIKNGARAALDFAKTVGTAIMKVIGSLASIPVVGWALGLAAAGTIAALAANYMNDGIISPSQGKSGYGDRVLYGPEGAISFNNKDTIVAGTNLFGDDVVSAPKGSVNMSSNNDALAAEMKEIKELLRALVNKQGDVMMDSTKVGKALMLAGYQIS